MTHTRSCWPEQRRGEGEDSSIRDEAAVRELQLQSRRGGISVL